MVFPRLNPIITLFAMGTPLFVLNGPTSQATEYLDAQKLKGHLHFYESLSHLKANFRQSKWLKEMDLKLLSEGTLTLNRPDQVIWKILKPSPITVILNPKSIEIRSQGIDGKENTVKLSASESAPEKISQSLKSLAAWLNLDANFLASEYFIEALPSHRFIFTPKNPGQNPFQSLEMLLSQDGHLTRLNLHERSGDRVELVFQKPQVKRVPKK